MREKDEAELHRRLKRLEGRFETSVPWGKIALTVTAIPNFAGGRGCPDEILRISIELPILGTTMKASMPILVELENSGYSNAKRDLELYCSRSLAGEQPSYLEVPMIILGGDKYRLLNKVDKAVLARFPRTQVPRRMIDDSQC